MRRREAAPMTGGYRRALVGGTAAALGALVVGWWSEFPPIPLILFALVLGGLFALGNLAVKLWR